MMIINNDNNDTNNNSNNDNYCYCYYYHFSEAKKCWVGVRRGIVCLMSRKNSSALGGTLSIDGVSIEIPVGV